MDTKTSDYSGQRLREVTAWLRTRVSYDEVLRRMAEEARADEVARASKEWRRANRIGLWGWIFLLVSFLRVIWLAFALVNFMRKFEPGPKTFEQWHAAHARAGDELWEYDSGPESWEHLHGECGYALVRDGKVFEVWLVELN